MEAAQCLIFSMTNDQTPIGASKSAAPRELLYKWLSGLLPYVGTTLMGNASWKIEYKSDKHTDHTLVYAFAAIMYIGAVMYRSCCHPDANMFLEVAALFLLAALLGAVVAVIISPMCYWIAYMFAYVLLAGAMLHHYWLHRAVPLPRQLAPMSPEMSDDNIAASPPAAASSRPSGQYDNDSVGSSSSGEQRIDLEGAAAATALDFPSLIAPFREPKA